jgi:hypothetical protein
MPYDKIRVPSVGEKIVIQGGKVQVPDNPIVLYIEGDGIGPDITNASKAVWDAAVKTAYQGKRKIEWMEIYAGKKAADLYGNNNYMPEESFDALREFGVGIKGPLETPIGGGIRSLNVTLRLVLDLYVCLRPVRWYTGVPSPLKEPGKVNVVIFRENTEDVYAGIEYKAGLLKTPGPRVPARGTWAQFREWRRPGHQAEQRLRHEAARPPRHRIRHRAQAQERDSRPQRQHPEVHRGCLPRVGLPACQRGIRR